jgi:futalosine hydrolase
VTRLLVVTAVPAEQAAVLGARPSALGTLAGLAVHRSRTPAGLLDVACGGVGPVTAALSTAALLQATDYDYVISAGIGGGFPNVSLGDLVIADEVVHADLGAQTADGGFDSLAELGWGPVRVAVDPGLAGQLSRRTSGALGTVLSVSTVTGTQAAADRLLERYPDALAEAMEGAGCGQAAHQASVRFAEIRAISNPVGPRDRAAWRIADALAVLTAAFDQLLAEPFDRSEPA